jgi:hypothetical protein
METAKTGELMDADTADAIGRAYKYGGLGLVTWYIGTHQPAWFKSAGFFNVGGAYNKNNQNRVMKPETIQLGGKNIWRPMSEHQFVAAVQFWATKNAIEQEMKDDEYRKLVAGVSHALMGLGQHAPGLEEFGQAGSAASGQSRDAENVIGNILAGDVIPAIVNQLATGTDKPETHSLTEKMDAIIAGEPVARQADTIGRTMMSRVPVLREKLPKKGVAGRRPKTESEKLRAPMKLETSTK